MKINSQDLYEIVTLLIISVLGYMSCMYGLQNRDGKALLAYFFALAGLARIIVGILYLIS